MNDDQTLTEHKENKISVYKPLKKSCGKRLKKTPIKIHHRDLYKVTLTIQFNSD